MPRQLVGRLVSWPNLLVGLSGWLVGSLTECSGGWLVGSRDPCAGACSDTFWAFSHTFWVTQSPRGCFRHIFGVFRHILGDPESRRVFQTHFLLVSDIFLLGAQVRSDTFWVFSDTFWVSEIFQTHWARGRVQNALMVVIQGLGRPNMSVL